MAKYPNYSILFFITALFLFFRSAEVYAQDNVCTALNAYTIPLHQDSSFHQFSFLDSTLQHVEVLALGENSHGTHEFFTSKFEIIKYCVTNLNYKVIGIESDYAGTELANEYITIGKGTVQSAVYNMGIMAWMTQEMRDMLDWLKEYNQGKKDEDKIRLFGFDMQSSAIALNQLKSTLIPLGFGSVAFIDTMLTWKTAKQVDKNLLKKLSAEILYFAGKQDVNSQTKLEGLVRAMNESVTFLSITDQRKRLNFRDQFMYKNALDVYRRGNAKMIVWAHNEHVTKTSNFKWWSTMGYLLHQDLGIQYYALGLMTIQGKVGFVNRFTKSKDSLDIPHDTKASVESFFATCGSPYFCLDIKQVVTNSAMLTKHLNTMAETITIDVTVDMQKQKYTVTKNYFKNRVINKFDGILFIRTTTAARH